MKLGARRRQVAAAERRARSARAVLHYRAEALRGISRRHREEFLVGGGLVSGMLVALLPVRAWSRLGAIVFGTTAFVLRSPISGILLGSVLQVRRTPSGEAGERSGPQ